MCPSFVHEQRVELLEHMSRLAGCTVACTVGPGLDPDVLLSHPRRRLVFLGEAKRSETPGNSHTERRLRRYLRALRWLQRHRFAARFALCGDPLEAAGWSWLLVRLASSERVVVASTGTVDVESKERVVWLDLLPTEGELPRPAFLRSWRPPA